MSINQLFDKNSTHYFDYYEGRSEAEIPYARSRFQIKKTTERNEEIFHLDTSKNNKRKISSYEKKTEQIVKRKKADTSNRVTANENCHTLEVEKPFFKKIPNHCCLSKRNLLEIPIKNCLIQHIVVKSNPNNITLFFSGFDTIITLSDTLSELQAKLNCELVDNHMYDKDSFDQFHKGIQEIDNTSPHFHLDFNSYVIQPINFQYLLEQLTKAKFICQEEMEKANHIFMCQFKGEV